MSSEWIGLIGGLAGTVLGWILSTLSQKGRLYLYTEWNDEVKQDDHVGGTVKSTNQNDAEFYIYHLTLDLYNASNESKIMREIEIVFYKGRKELFRLVPQDANTEKFIAAHHCYDDIQPITISAKSIIRLELRGCLFKSDSEFQRLWDSNKIKLSYCKKGKRRKDILISKKRYADYFEN